MYLLLIVGFRWRWACCNGWLWIIIWIIIWVLVTTISLRWVLIFIFFIVSSCGTWIGTISSGTILLAVVCGIGVVLRQLHGLLLSVGVHLASSSVVAIVFVIVVLDHHELGQVS
jgi:hypothetical protein